MPKLLIDTNHLCIRTLFAGKIVGTEESFHYHRHLVLNTILSNIRKFEPSEVILAVDDKKNWRKKVYPEYKANRKLIRDASDFPWDKYYVYMDEFLTSLQELPFKVIRDPFSESDDIIAVLSKHSQKGTIILTSDSDYIQLLQHKHNKLFDPIKKRYIEEKDPLKLLKIKIVSGDSGDNIPAIKPRVGEKTAIKLIDTGELEKLLENEEIKQNYLRNERLISFDYIPVVIQKEILNTYNNYKFPEGNVDYLGWFVSHKLKALSSELQNIRPIFQKLKGNSELDELF